MTGAIIGISGSLLVVMVISSGALWYRCGELEGRMAGIEEGR
jgi:hypothetical protein